MADLRDMTLDERFRLLTLAQTARSGSYSPYSKFRVGAALLLSDGTFVTGANIENASYGGAICAERTALVKAVSEGKKRFVALAVAADIDEPCSPCGICRQFIRGTCTRSALSSRSAEHRRCQSSVPLMYVFLGHHLKLQ